MESDREKCAKVTVKKSKYVQMINEIDKETVIRELD